MDITHITSLLGGIALFLYGMSIMGAGLEKLAGGKMQGVLQKLTSSTIKGVIFGTLITGVIQSSAGTVVICVGLVNSGIMTLTQSVGVIMGANIGTTVTGQLIRMADISGESLLLTLIQPKTFAPVVAFVGCIFYVFLRNAKKKNIGQIMLGFGILFTGMSLMDTGVSPLRESASFQELFVSMTNPVLGVLVGMVVTVIIQSSSASVGILQALSSTGLVTFGSAIPIILGAHIGTAFTPLLLQGRQARRPDPPVFQHHRQLCAAGRHLRRAVHHRHPGVGRRDEQEHHCKHPHPFQCGGHAAVPAFQQCALQAGHAHRAQQCRGSTGDEYARAG